MDFSQFKMEDVLAEGVLRECENALSSFYIQLGRLNTNLYTVERVLGFPSELFGLRGPGWSAFFIAFVANALDANTLIITRLATDSGGNSLKAFKNRMLSMVKPEYKEDFQEHLRNARFDQRTSALLKKAERLRNTRVAHLGAEDLAPRTYPEDDVCTLLAEQKVICDSLNSLYKALRFNTDVFFLPPQYLYSDRLGNDVDFILDCIARNSSVLTLPEDFPDLWRERRSELSREQLDRFNFYRRRFSLSAA